MLILLRSQCHSRNESATATKHLASCYISMASNRKILASRGCELVRRCEFLQLFAFLRALARRHLGQTYINYAHFPKC